MVVQSWGGKLFSFESSMTGYSQSQCQSKDIFWLVMSNCLLHLWTLYELKIVETVLKLTKKNLNKWQCKIKDSVKEEV